jgi:hypothetical protein
VAARVSILPSAFVNFRCLLQFYGSSTYTVAVVVVVVVLVAVIKIEYSCSEPFIILVGCLFRRPYSMIHTSAQSNKTKEII